METRLQSFLTLTDGRIDVSTEEIIAELNAAIEEAEEAWDLASQAKEKAQAARMRIAAVGGRSAPQLLTEALSLLDRSYEAFQTGQSRCTSSTERVESYKEKIS
jgi:hypothetical protein